MGPKRPLYSHLAPLIFEDDFGDQYEFPDYPAIAKDYCHKVIAGTWPACNYVKRACQRYLDMLKLAEAEKYGFVFSKAHACDFLAFTEELPLAQDNFRGVKKTELEPWQILCGCVIYGFRDSQYGFRWILEFYMEVPRKQAKSVLATAIGLYDVRDEGYTAPTVLIAASTLDQAGRVYEPIRAIVNHKTDTDLRTLYGLKATKEMLTCETTGGTIEKVASIGERQDGWNPTTIILEELHAQNPDVYAVLKSAIGSRGGQLLFQITTAGRDTFGLAWDNRKSCIQILEGHDTNWRYFGIIYTLDKEDLLDAQGNKSLERALNEEALWVKACPNLGVSFDIGAFRLLALSAKQKPQEREEFYRTRVNIWTNAASKLFNIESFRRGARPDLTIQDLKGKPAWIGLDASTADDLSSISVLVEYSETEIAFINKFYAASDAPIFSDPDYAGMCRDWRERGLISAQREGRVNHNEIEADLREWFSMLDVVVIGADPAMAGQMMQNLEDDKIPVVKYLNKAYMMSAPVDDLMARAHAESKVQLIYDANPVTEWCFANVHGEKKKDGTILMFKDTESSLNKIDGAVAVAIANGLRMNPEFADKVRKKPSVYEKRGLLGANS